MQDECAMVHDRSMTATENLKAAKAPKAVAVKSDGTLSKLNLAKLNTASVGVCRFRSGNGGQSAHCYN